jgi:anaerobic magnesium-protoporphyrin IX monomethyl ester cyclase
MKTCICTTPIRPYPTAFPPFGSMAIIQSLRKIKINAEFYNIDYFRYSHKEIEEHFEKQQFDVVGISSVVSTAYSYTKYLSKLIHRVSPETLIIVGGNLAASSEILLNNCEVDFCVIGDGEFIIQDLMLALKEKPLNYDNLRNTKGIAFLDEQNNFCFTGFGVKPSAEEIEIPDYNILIEDGSFDHYVPIASNEKGSVGEHIKPGKRVPTVITTKGCVARCTFCHRFEQGFRALPVKQLTEHLHYLVSNYNVGFIRVNDENFGADRKVAWEVAKIFGELGLKWAAGGVRTRTVSKESLQHWKDNGCVEVNYGIESGSPKMLKIMEKNLGLEENINALKWTGEAELNTTIQLVIGMPGEDDDTILETLDFLKKVSPYIKKWKGGAPSQSLSINYAQALPGTPLYEYCRQHSLIGNTIDAEEEYLIKISGIDAYSQDHFVNLTGLPLLKVLLWRPLIIGYLDAYHYPSQPGGKSKFSLLEVTNYFAKLAINKLYRLLGSGPSTNQIRDSGYFNLSRGIRYSVLLLNPMTKIFFFPVVISTLLVSFLKTPKFLMLNIVFDYMRAKFKSRSSAQEKIDKSLRKIVTITPSKHNMSKEDQMLPLRKGR